MTRLASRFLVIWTRIESRWEKWWLDSSNVFCRMSQLESQSMTRVRVIFTKSVNLCWTNTVRLHTKKWAIFVSVMIKIGANFLLWLFSRAMLYFKDQVSPTCAEKDLRLLLLRGQQGNILTLYRGFNAVFVYHDHGRGPHTVRPTLSLFQIPVSDLSVSDSNPIQKL